MFPHCQALARDICSTSKDEFLNIKDPAKFVLTRIMFSFIFICGFSCKSVSRCNEQAPNNKTCISDKASQTGATFEGTIDHIAEVHPLICILENVSSLRGQNLDDVIESLRPISSIISLNSSPSQLQEVLIIPSRCPQSKRLSPAVWPFRSWML